MAMRFDCFMVSCPEREAVRQQTLLSLGESDWPAEPELILDAGCGTPRIERIHDTWWRALSRASTSRAELVLLLEDDLIINRWLFHNVCLWPPLNVARETGWFYGSLYNPVMASLEESAAERYLIAFPRFVYGSQALLFTPRTIHFLLEHWDTERGNPDERMPKIASKVTPLYYHIPSLVDHRLVPTTWGGFAHRSHDFSAEWKAG